MTRLIGPALSEPPAPSAGRAILVALKSGDVELHGENQALNRLLADRSSGRHEIGASGSRLGGSEKMLGEAGEKLFGKSIDAGASWLTKKLKHRGASYFEVDISPQACSESFAVETKDKGVDFDVSIEYRAQIYDPIEAYHRGVVDLDGHFSAKIQNALDEIGGRFTFEQRREAGRAMREALEAGLRDPVAQLVSPRVDVSVDEEVAAGLRADSMQRMRQNERERVRGATDNYEELELSILTERDPSRRAMLVEAYNRRVEADDRGAINRLRHIEFLVKNEIMSEQEVRRRFSDAMVDQMFGSGSGPAIGSDSPQTALPSRDGPSGDGAQPPRSGRPDRDDVA